MTRQYLEREAARANSGRRKLFLAIFIFFCCVSAFLYFAVGSSLDLSKPGDKKMFVIFIVMAGLILLSTAVQLVISLLPARNGANLILPLRETTREAAAEVINREAAEGKILYEGFMNHNTIKKYNTRITILPSYVLLIREIDKITAIPRDQICWIGAQPGYKGGPFYARLLIITEKMILDFDGNDNEHLAKIAENIHQYIPNVFRDYMAEHGMDMADFAYVLEKCYNENRANFMRFYEAEKQKLNKSSTTGNY